MTTIALYEDSDGAEAAYDLRSASDSPSNTEMRGWDTFGDRSQGLNDDASDGRSGMMISVLLDNLVFRFYTYFPEDEPIDEDAFADLTSRSNESRSVARPCNRRSAIFVLRFDAMWAWRDLYMWRGGVMNRYVNQTEDVEYYAEEAESNGETEHFSMGTLLNAEETAENSEFVWQRVGLRRYEDEDAAETRFAEMLDSVANDEGFEAFDLVDVDFGDESFRTMRSGPKAIPITRATFMRATARSFSSAVRSGANAGRSRLDHRCPDRLFRRWRLPRSDSADPGSLSP
ncbi:MAG: hypothetical protein R2843_00790 [Thermomicrobiales bacterium]